MAEKEKTNYSIPSESFNSKAYSGVDLSAFIKISSEEVDNLKKEIDRLEKRTEKQINLSLTITIGIVIAFFIALVFLVFDYFNFRNNYIENESAEKRFSEIETNLEVNNSQLNCLKLKSYVSSKCFE